MFGEDKSYDTSNMSLDMLKNNFEIILILQLGFIVEISFTKIYEFSDLVVLLIQRPSTCSTRVANYSSKRNHQMDMQFKMPCNSL